METEMFIYTLEKKKRKKKKKKRKTGEKIKKVTRCVYLKCCMFVFLYDMYVYLKDRLHVYFKMFTDV